MLDGIHSLDVNCFSCVISLPPGHDQYLGDGIGAGGGGGGGGDGDGVGGDGGGDGDGDGGGADGDGDGAGGGDGRLGRGGRPPTGLLTCLFIPSTHLQLSK